MRTAANDLRRADPRAAAESGSRAAEQLRRLEEQMHGSSADARQRAAGELQLEAQQIADAQRRVAAEAERLDKENADNSDALRRLAGEKEGLADRTDALQRAAEQLAKAGGTPGNATASTAAGDAARELQREQIGRRMRDSAKQMRDAAVAESTKQSGNRSARPAAAVNADAEQQLARALDKVAERLGGSASTDAKKLSDQLDESREIRDRLDRLERQIREAEARQQAERLGRNTTPGTDGRQGQRGRQGSTGAGDGGELQRLREEYARELQRARDALGRLQQAAPRDGLGGSTPEQHEYSLSAPGNEAFKQDFAKWESLRKDVNVALDRYESAVSQRLARKLAEDRLSAGASERVPDAYARPIARYYESLARTKK
jgi:hypothetical protein